MGCRDCTSYRGIIKALVGINGLIPCNVWVASVFSGNFEAGSLRRSLKAGFGVMRICWNLIIGRRPPYRGYVVYSLNSLQGASLGDYMIRDYYTDC